MKRDQCRDWAASGEHLRTDHPSVLPDGQMGAAGVSPMDIGGDPATDMVTDPTLFWRIAKMGRLGSSKLRFDDDFADRLNYQMTSVLIFILISATGIRQYFGKPIQCWIPQEFTRGWEEYAESFCWVSYTYFVPISERFPRSSTKKQMKISYYQWAAIVLGIQALLFYIPCLIWRLLLVQSGFNLRRIIQVASESNTLLPAEQMQKSVRFIAHHMDRCLSRKKVYGTGIRARLRRAGQYLRGGCCGRFSGRYLAGAYLIVKLLYLLNIIGQLFLMQRFIGTTYLFYGVQVLYDLVSGTEWTSSGHFPRVTFCDFEAKKLGKNHIYTLQCVLPLNMFLEKIFIFLWFWHVLVGLVTLFSFTNWISLLCSTKHRQKLVRDYLSLLEDPHHHSYTHARPSLTPEEALNAVGSFGAELTAWLRTFTYEYIQYDGLFIIQLISINVSDIMAGEVVCELWSLYRYRKTYFMEAAKKYKLSNATCPQQQQNQYQNSTNIPLQNSTEASNLQEHEKNIDNNNDDIV